MPFSKIHHLAILTILAFLVAGCSSQPPTASPEPAVPSTVEPKTDMNQTNLPLTIPEGFKLEEWATGVSGARVLIGPDQMGNFWLSRTNAGIVSRIELAADGSVAKIDNVFTDLNEPHGLLIDPTDAGRLLIAETDKVLNVRIDAADTLHTLVDLPEGGRHFSRTLLAGPDGKIYISIGSSCDVCAEDDERRASVWRMNPDGSEFEKFASGLRYSVFLTIDPVSGGIWATEMGRDNLGDDIPPDEINILQAGQNYGWPFCFGTQIRDQSFGDFPADF
jgi:glucose/arabinose dehydrogenase